MKELSCEDVLMAQMAAADGEEPAFSEEQLATHMTGCTNCQSELKQLLALDRVLVSHTLAEQHVEDRSGEGHRPRQRFVEGDAHAVPIAGL